MSKKHFVALAEMVRNMDASGAVCELVAKELADVCIRFNNNFDRERFLAACGIES